MSQLSRVQHRGTDIPDAAPGQFVFPGICGDDELIQIDLVQCVYVNAAGNQQKAVALLLSESARYPLVRFCWPGNRLVIYVVMLA